MAAILRRAGGRRLVIVAPHPDDETLGCGRLIAAAARAGVRLAVVALTDGDASHPGSRRWCARDLGRLRRAELRRALARLGAGAAALRFMAWGDGQVAGRHDARALRAALLALRPGIVLAASPRDHHADHQAGWAVTRAALRGTGVPLLAYAVWSRLAGATSRRAGPHAAAKGWAARAHRSQTSGYIADDPAGFTLRADELHRLVFEPEQFEVISSTRSARQRRS